MRHVRCRNLEIHSRLLPSGIRYGIKVDGQWYMGLFTGYTTTSFTHSSVLYVVRGLEPQANPDATLVRAEHLTEGVVEFLADRAVALHAAS